jgi:ubiquinone/menaquinone biosynthesis C-methylase UbiE
MASSTSGNPEQEIARYYTHGSLLQTILDALKAAGVDPERPSADDLAPVDEFHTGGRVATLEFAEEMGIAPGMHLLDIGSGIGGPSRYFAGHRGCLVKGIDLSAEFCNTAKELSSRAGLGDRTEYRQASGVSLPFDAAVFDGAYMLHVGMNIAAKADLFREVARVLKPGAVFGIFDVMREAEGDLKFPVPWASAQEMSFVESAATYTELLRAAGFEIEKQRSRRDFALAFFAKMREIVAAVAASGGPPPLGLPILMGPSAPVKVGNLMSMIERGMLSPTEIVGRRR